MSRSKRKPYVKDKGMSTQEYWGSIRRIWKQQINSINFWDEDFNFKHPKEIHNDYDYCDWNWEIKPCHENDNFILWTKEHVKIYSRK
jgi:hypothetical protein